MLKRWFSLYVFSPIFRLVEEWKNYSFLLLHFFFQQNIEVPLQLNAFSLIKTKIFLIFESIIIII